MKVRDILDRVTTLYHDIEYRRCTPQQYLQFLDDAILALITLRPDSHEKREVIQLKPGARQKVPDDGYVLIDVYANMQYIPEINYYFDGKPVYQVARKDLDYFSNWYNKVERRATIDEFAYDIRSPGDFWVNPPVSPLSDVRVEIGYSYKHPTYGDMDMSLYPFPTIKEMELELSDSFRNALVSYMLYKIFSVDVTAERDIQIGAQHLQTFYQSLNFNFNNEIMATTRIIEPTTQGIGLQTTDPMNVQTVRI